MTKQQARQRIKKLRELIDKYRYSRHVLDKELVSIDVEDSLKKELFDLEQYFPDLVTPDSPTQRVGGKPLEKFEKVRHPEPMLSFNDAFSQKDMEDWLERVSKLLTAKEKEKIDFYCEPKLDGLAIELIYKEGILEVGSTRGDGLIGEDVTRNLKTIEAIPLKINLGDFQSSLRVIARGEVIITKKEFEKINQEQGKKDLSLFANPRNLAAGSIRQLDPEVTRQRHLDSTCYELITDLGQKTHEDKHRVLAVLGFKTNNKYSKYSKDLDEVFNFYENTQKLREKFPYEIDGIVVIINDIEIFEKLGVVGKAPRGAIAYKFPLKQATTTIEDIRVQVGRTGAVTPVAYLKPVDIGGATISRATLHNEDEIKKLGVKIGDTVVVGRAGDVIPDVIKVLPELRTGREKEFHFPKKCPVCQRELIKPEGEAVWRCPNLKCFARQREYFYYFVKSFDIVGLGPKIVDKLLDAGLVSDPADLFKLGIGDILSLPGFAGKSAKNLIEAIQSKKQILLPRLIYALGIRNVGEETAQDLAECFGSINKMENASLGELQKITDIGPQVSKNIYDWFREKRNSEFLEKLRKVGVKIISEKRKAPNRKFEGKIFVLTGSLETVTRTQAKEKIRLFGGEISESVSERTDYLVAGKEPGTKLEKAKKLGITIIGEREFLEMIK
jgi:DNA ligase (NAD+)